MQLRLAIDRSGSVTETKVEPRTTLSDPTVVSCIEQAAGRLSFPQTGANVVLYGLAFQPTGQ